MKITLIKQNLFKQNRLHLNCPKCSEDVILDEFVFMEDPTEIYCNKCDSKYMVLKIDSISEKGKMFIHVTKYTKNEK